MLRSTHRHHLVFTHRPVERFGRRAAPVSTAACLEATLDGDPCGAVGDALDRLGRLLAGADLTGWFPEPVLPHLTRWLLDRLRPTADAARRPLRTVTVTAADLRCDLEPR